VSFKCFFLQTKRHGKIDFKLNKKSLSNLFDRIIETIGKDEVEKLFIKKNSEILYPFQQTLLN
jgi:hypothetical protein